MKKKIRNRNITHESSLFSLVYRAAVPSLALVELCKILGIKHDATLDGLVASTQEKLLFLSHNKETLEDGFLSNKKEALLALVEELGCVREIYVSPKHYHYALVLGTFLDEARLRLQFLVDQWNKGVRFDTLVLLTGQRLLTSFEQKALRAVSEQLSTETDMMRWVYKDCTMPVAMRAVALDVVDARAESGTERPTTACTVKAWLRSQPQPGCVLAVSSQPFVGYQNAVLKSYIPPAFCIETVGAAAQPQTSIKVYLDTLARWLYQERELCRLRHKDKISTEVSCR